jgi:hypothetical protein
MFGGNAPRSGFGQPYEAPEPGTDLYNPANGFMIPTSMEDGQLGGWVFNADSGVTYTDPESGMEYMTGYVLDPRTGSMGARPGPVRSVHGRDASRTQLLRPEWTGGGRPLQHTGSDRGIPDLGDRGRRDAVR